MFYLWFPLVGCVDLVCFLFSFRFFCFITLYGWLSVLGWDFGSFAFVGLLLVFGNCGFRGSFVADRG